MMHFPFARPAFAFRRWLDYSTAPHRTTAPGHRATVESPARGRKRLRGSGAAGGLLLLAGFATAAVAEPPQRATGEAPSPVFHRSGGSPSLGLRPIGAPPAANPSAPRAGQAVASRTTADGATPAGAELRTSNGAILQTAFMQQGDFNVPADMGGSPPAGAASQFEAPPLAGNDYGSATRSPSAAAPPPASPPTTSYPTAPSLQGLQPVAPLGAPLAAPPQHQPNASPSDLAPLPQPQLPSNWATVDNCNLVSGPSGYRAEFGFCSPAPVVPVGYAAPPVILPPAVAPGAPMAPAPFGCRPLFTLGQENYNVQVGQGIIGQPTAYVPGQNIRNFIRYLSP